jgi:hypothetical protein
MREPPKEVKRSRASAQRLQPDAHCVAPSRQGGVQVCSEPRQLGVCREDIVMIRLVGLLGSFAIGCAVAVSGPLAAQGPEQPPFDSFGRADDAVRICQRAGELFGIALPVGVCLALLRENSTNELATACAHIQRAGLLPLFPDEDEYGEPIITVADCIRALQDL